MVIPVHCSDSRNLQTQGLKMQMLQHPVGLHLSLFLHLTLKLPPTDHLPPLSHN